MFIDKLTGELAQQFSGSDLPISAKHFVEISCSCGKITKLSTRALSRKWGTKGYYLCKSCSVKSYVSNPERLEKFRETFTKTAATLEHKAKCSEGGRKVWANPITRKKITEAVRADNISNPKKAVSRAIALKALKEKSWFKDHMAKMRILAHQAIKISLNDDSNKWQDLAKNFHLERPEVKEKHRRSTKNRQTKKQTTIYSYEELDNNIKSSGDYQKRMATILNHEKHKAELAIIQIPQKHKRAKQNSIEYKAKLAAAAKSQWENQKYRDKMREVYESEEFREKMSIAGIASWKYPEYRKKMIANLASLERKEKMIAAGTAMWENPEFREKMTAILSSPEVREKMSVASKARWKNPEFRKKMAIALAAQSGHTSSIQTKLYSYLDELGVEYHKEGEKTCIGFYVFDCLVINGDKKILIECQGDYWHSLQNAERRDRGKFTYISRYFPEYEIMYIWEHEFYCKDRVLDRLKLKLGLNIETKEFDFSDLMLREINSTETKTFLDLYHYLGKDRGGKAFGAFHNDLLVAVIVFSPPLRQNTAGQFGLKDGEVRELSRLCIHPSYHKRNFASWFIKRTLKQIESKLVIAYADTTVGHAGTIYKASNFKLHHTVPADYWYVDISGYVMHKRTLYGKARSLKMAENEFAETKGYIRKYGGEKLCFIYNQK